MTSWTHELWFNFIFGLIFCFKLIAYLTVQIKRERKNILNHNDKTEPKHIHVHCMCILPMQNIARSSVFHSYEEVWKVQIMVHYSYVSFHYPPSSSTSLPPPTPLPPHLPLPFWIIHWILRTIDIGVIVYLIKCLERLQVSLAKSNNPRGHGFIRFPYNFLKAKLYLH